MMRNIARTSLPNRTLSLLTLTAWTLANIVLVSGHYGQDVKELTQLTFDPFLSSSANSPILLQFYSPGCKHCMRFAPVYEAIHNDIRGEVNVTRVDGEEHRVLRMRFRVHGFPTFFLIHNRKIWQFEGQRTRENMMKFVESRGATHGKPIDIMLGGPLSPYWSVISALFSLADRVRLFALNYEQRPFTLLAIIFGSLFCTLFTVAVVLHIVTTPRIARPQHPHQE